MELFDYCEFGNIVLKDVLSQAVNICLKEFTKKVL